jgi:hypothetical protein
MVVVCTCDGGGVQINALLDVGRSAFLQLEEAEATAQQSRGPDTTLDSDEDEATHSTRPRRTQQPTHPTSGVRWLSILPPPPYPGFPVPLPC